MPVKASESGVYDVSDYVVANSTATDDAYTQLRRDYDRFFDQSIFSSRGNVQEVKNWLDTIAGDEEQIREARQNFRQYTVPLLEKENKLYGRFKRDLDDALKERTISRDSYNEWLEWVYSDNVDAAEKKKSLTGAHGSEEDFPVYMKLRQDLAKKRSELLGDRRLDEVKDPELKSKIELVREDRKFFEDLSVTERFSTINEIIAKLRVAVDGEYPKEWVAEAEKKLQAAAALSVLHRDKVGGWLEKIFVQWPKTKGWKAEQVRKFVFGSGANTLDGFIKDWRGYMEQFLKMRGDKALKGVNAGFVNTKGFLAMSTGDRKNYVTKTMPGAIARAGTLRRQAEGLVRSAGTVGVLDAAGQKRWMEAYVFNGNYSLDELGNIITGNMAQRLDRKVGIARRFDAVSKDARKVKGIRGMKIPERPAFLKMKFPGQATLVAEMEHRLREIEKNRPDFLRIRHFMDRKDWDSAEDLIVKARRMGPHTFEDDGQLLSMENYIKLYRKNDRADKKAAGDIVDPTLPESGQIDQLISLASPALQPLCISLCERGSRDIGALGWTMYNRDWCWKNGYLSYPIEEQAIATGQSQALQKMRRRHSGVVSETIQGKTAEEEFIELSKTGATNVCVDITDAGALTALGEKIHDKRDDARALYWTNTIFHRGGTPMSLEQQNHETDLVYRMRSLLQGLEKRGERYSFRPAETHYATAA